MKLPDCCRCPADALRRAVRTADAGRGRQRGVALITVLLIVFLASVTAAGLAAMQQITIRRSAVMQHQQQARLYTLAVEQWALLALARDGKQSQSDHPDEEWAKASALLPIKEGALSGHIRDLQGCFNLNSLWLPSSKMKSPQPGNDGQENSPDAEPTPDQPAPDQPKRSQADASPQKSPENPSASDAPEPAADEAEPGKGRLNEAQFQVLQRLLARLELKPELAQAIVDWIDPDQDPLFPDGAEDSDYNVMTPPYLAANRPMLSVSELRSIKGVDRETFDKLAPLVCALPADAPLNVNTAPALVLAALAEGKDPKDIEQALESRPADGYKNVNEFLDAADLSVEARLKSQLSVATQHFLLQVEARVGDGRAMLYSTLYRDKNGARVLRRAFGNQD
ncbi:MAG: type II secretion system minor pseudopilin GspK [Candidatus Competibacteraceae bacterium]|nr:type II secretion system minor pseudopilin GspK [Candidatus Competibacteraceae bacterium]